MELISLKIANCSQSPVGLDATDVAEIASARPEGEDQFAKAKAYCPFFRKTVQFEVKVVGERSGWPGCLGECNFRSRQG